MMTGSNAEPPDERRKSSFDGPTVRDGDSPRGIGGAGRSDRDPVHVHSPSRCLRHLGP